MSDNLERFILAGVQPTNPFLEQSHVYQLALGEAAMLDSTSTDVQGLLYGQQLAVPMREVVAKISFMHNPSQQLYTTIDHYGTLLSRGFAKEVEQIYYEALRDSRWKTSITTPNKQPFFVFTRYSSPQVRFTQDDATINKYTIYAYDILGVVSCSPEVKHYDCYKNCPQALNCMFQKPVKAPCNLLQHLVKKAMGDTVYDNYATTEKSST